MKKHNTKKRAWEKPICNLCLSVNHKIFFDNMTYWEYEGVFTLVQCENCNLIFISPRPPIAEMGKYYVQEEYFGRNIVRGNGVHNDIFEREQMFGNVYRLILNKKIKGNILDIGAGTGLFLSKFHDLGWKTDGVELMKNAVTYAKKQYGVKLRTGDFFNHSFPKNSFDVITLNGALEHLYNPKETLQEAYTLLKKGGIVLFSVPNTDSIGRIIFGKNWFPWQPPRHLYHFSPKTATEMLTKSGFKNVTIQHNYLLQNYYILFQSLRYSISPKFKKKETGGLAYKNYKSTFSPKKELGKFLGAAFANIVANIEPVIKRGEVLIVYAKK